MRKRITMFLLFLFLLSFTSVSHASGGYVNPDTGYRTVLEDDADLLTSAQEQELETVLKSITAYGHAAYKTVNENPYSAETFAEDFYHEQFRSESGTLFLIDMENRMLWIQSDGAVYKTITKSYANTITDNVYRYASDDDYFTCSMETFNQILALLEGNKIAQPMKYASNAFLAVVLSMFLCYGLTRFMSSMKSPSNAHMPLGMKQHYSLTNTAARYTHESKHYSPVSSSSSGSSSSSSRSGGSSGGGGGSSSGGGGGHRF